jgi:homoserine acetyltransferase
MTSTPLDLGELSSALPTEGDGVETYKLGDWNLQCGQVIPDAWIAYKTFGDSKSPAIIYPSWYSGSKNIPRL